MYTQQILNDFYEALFCTNFYDHPCPTQNAKTDYICQAHYDDRLDELTYDEWLEQEIETFARESDYTVDEIKQAVSADPQFYQDLKEEFDYLIEECQELFDEEDEEEDEED